MTSAELALLIYDHNVYCVPAGYDSVGNRYFCIPYSHWRETPPNLGEYKEIWEAHSDKEIHIMCGKVGGIDVDAKNDPSGTIVRRFEEEVKEFCPDIFEKLYIEQTPSGGRHYLFFTERPLPTKNLAFVPKTPDMDDILSGKPIQYRPIIEYRGENGLCRCYPSPGISIIQGDITALGTLQEHEVSLLQYLCSLFDEKPEEKIVDAPRQERVTIETPGNDYSDRVPLSEFCDMLSGHGWKYRQRGARIFLRRPGARTKNFDADIKNRTFMNFSGSVNEFEVGKGYSLWRVYAILNHGGDFNAAAKALAAMGYGASATVTIGDAPPQSSSAAPYTEEAQNTIADRLRASRVVMSKPPQKKEYDLRWRAAGPGGGTMYDIAAGGMIVLVSGEQKARKTSLVTSIIAAGLCGQERAGFTLNLLPTDGVLWMDTEQGERHAFNTARRILIQALMSEFPDNVQYVSLSDYTVDEMNAILDNIDTLYPNTKVIVMDGAVDFVRDINESRENAAFGRRLLKIAKGRILFPVMHVNRTEGRANGHTGAMLEKRCSVHINVKLNDDNSSEVKFPDTRDEKPPAFSFSVIGPNIPVVDGYEHPNYDFSIGNPDYKPKDSDQNFPTEEMPTFNPQAMPMTRQEPDDLDIPAEALGLTEEELNELYR